MSRIGIYVGIGLIMFSVYVFVAKTFINAFKAIEAVPERALRDFD